MLDRWGLGDNWQLLVELPAGQAGMPARPRKKNANIAGRANIPFTRTAKPDVHGRDYVRHGVQKPLALTAGAFSLLGHRHRHSQCLSLRVGVILGGD